jgi:CBS domain-containing protein
MQLEFSTRDELSLLQSETVGSLLTRKGSLVWTVSPEATVYEAIALMDEKRVGALIAMTGTQLAGVISERDYARKVILKGRSSKETRVGDIMSSPVITAAPGSRVNECLRLMADRRIRHLPVMDGADLVGIVSIGDLVNSVLRMQAAAVQELTSYVAGSYPR